MGRTRTPEYRVQFFFSSAPHVSQFALWSSEETPNNVNLEAWRVSMNDSFKKGQSNAHLAGEHVWKAEAVHQSSGRVVATTKMPMFEVA